jgi:predicted TIM-barrel fold metal-dependent hydrolase
MGYDIISADAHILEPKNIWETWLPKQYQDKAPKLAKDVDGGDGWVFAGASEPDPIGLVSTPGKPYDEFSWTGVTYEDARAGCYNGVERLKDMDIDGVDAEVLFPPQRTIGHFLGDDDDEFVLAGIEAYNNFLFEEFMEPDRSRLIGMAQIPSLGVENAVEVLRKSKARGFKGVTISCWPAGGESISQDDDPFWAAAQDEEMPVCIHINLISRKSRQKQRQAAEAARKAGGGGLYGGKRPDANAKAVGGLAGVFSTVPSTMSQLLFTGVFERFPRLHISLIETGVGWIPHYLAAADDRYWRNRSWGNIPIKQPPSYYWFQNMSATFIIDRSGIRERHAAGIDNIMWSTDYPHHGNDWPYSRKVIDEMMGHIPLDERRKIVCDNAQRIFHLDGD